MASNIKRKTLRIKIFKSPVDMAVLMLKENFFHYQTDISLTENITKKKKSTSCQYRNYLASQ